MTQDSTAYCGTGTLGGKGGGGGIDPGLVTGVLVASPKLRPRSRGENGRKGRPNSRRGPGPRLLPLTLVLSRPSPPLCPFTPSEEDEVVKP